MKTALERGIESLSKGTGGLIYIKHGVQFIPLDHAEKVLRETVAEAVKEEMQKLYEFVASSERTIAPTCLGEEILDEIAKYLTNPTTEERG